MPILYGVGSFILQNDGLLRQPADARRAAGLPPDAPAEAVRAKAFTFAGHERFAETVVVELSVRAGRASQLRLTPMELRLTGPTGKRGFPTRAGADVAERIAARLVALSTPFGTALRPAGEALDVVLPATAS